jgi:quinol monooxygenase YgiN
MSKLAAFIKLKCQPGKRDEVRQLYEEYVKPRVEGKQAVEFVFYCYDIGDEDTICVFELIADVSATAKSAGSDWFQEYQQRLQALLAEPQEMLITAPVYAKGASL